MIRILCLALVALGLGACAADGPDWPIDLPGELALSETGFPFFAPPRGWGAEGDWRGFDWIRDGEDDKQVLRVVPSRGRGGVLYRRTDLLLAVHPYLSWHWWAETDQPTGARLLVGFRIGQGSGRGLYDHAVSIGFGGAMPVLVPHERDRPGPVASRPHLIAGWHRDGVDLIAAHQRFWPELAGREVRVSLIAVQSLPGTDGQTGSVRLTGILLSR